MKPYSLHPESIQHLFNNIAPTYDLLNHLLSLRRDIYWRRMAVREFKEDEGWMLDVATGTGDMAIELVRQNGLKKRVLGLDFSKLMLEKAQEKILKRNLFHRVILGLGDALSLPCRDSTFSGSMIAFGLRNIIHKEQALSEMVRVIKPGGKVVILEFTYPRNGLMRKIYPVYFKKILPWIGGWISGDKSAYDYLPDSVSRFRFVEEYEALMRQSGLTDVHTRPLTGGIASIITGKKKDE